MWKDLSSFGPAKQCAFYEYTINSIYGLDSIADTPAQLFLEMNIPRRQELFNKEKCCLIYVEKLRKKV